MLRRFVCAGFAVALVCGVVGCEKPPVSTNSDAPVKASEGVDKKGKKTKTMEASFEDPGTKK